MTGSSEQSGHLQWKRTLVDGRPAEYGVGGTGRPLVFLHGWGLGQRSYKRALRRLVQQGAQVWAPALPGFGGTADLPRSAFSLSGYGQWVQQFLDAVGVDQPVVLVGHSFGGGVAIRTAADAPERVDRLVVVNSIGGSAWSDRRGVLRTVAERPVWDWGLHLQADIWSLRQATRVLPVILEDALPNVLRNPRALWRVGRLAGTANLTAELEQLKERGMPVVILWGEQDEVIPHSTFVSLCEAFGEPEVRTVPGGHSWLLADPEGFGEIMTNIIGLAALPESLAVLPTGDEGGPGPVA